MMKEDKLMNKLEGYVVGGLGRGAHFLSVKEYKDKIKRKLGIDIYEGTLNIKVGEKEKCLFLSSIKPVNINGFKAGGKEYGGIVCYRAKVKKIKGAVIIPLKTKNPKNVVEFIAKYNLRKKLGLKENAKITIEED